MVRAIKGGSITELPRRGLGQMGRDESKMIGGKTGDPAGARSCSVLEKRDWGGTVILSEILGTEMG